MPKATAILKQARKEKGTVKRLGNKRLEKMYQMYELRGEKVVSKNKLKEKIKKEGIIVA